MITPEQKAILDKGCAGFVAREMQWFGSNRRGRWLVIKPGPGRLLKDVPQHLRDLMDTMTRKRGRRFSSLSRARSFAREVGGEVRRWRRELTLRYRGRKVRGDWRLETNPWAGATGIHPDVWIRSLQWAF